MKIVVDSNIWIAFFDEDDSQHTKAHKFLEQVTQEIIVPEYILAEVCTILKQKIGKPVADAFMRHVYTDPYLHPFVTNENDFLQITDFFLRHEHQYLSFVDVFLLQMSIDYPVFTFDKKLDRAIKRLSKS